VGYLQPAFALVVCNFGTARDAFGTASVRPQFAAPTGPLRDQTDTSDTRRVVSVALGQRSRGLCLDWRHRSGLALLLPSCSHSAALWCSAEHERTWATQARRGTGAAQTGADDADAEQARAQKAAKREAAVASELRAASAGREWLGDERQPADARASGSSLFINGPEPGRLAAPRRVCTDTAAVNFSVACRHLISDLCSLATCDGCSCALGRPAHG
jgi:hypothetical protein